MDFQSLPHIQPPPGAQRWKLTLSYDGTDFRGWQVQPGAQTVQGVLAAALHRVTGESVLPQGSGRTDAGVHALAQVASVDLRAPIPPANLQRALNRALPAAVRVLAAEHAAAGFHARHSAVGKTYEYRVLSLDARRGELCSPFLARYVFTQDWKLDHAAMQAAAAAVLGEHDFTSFAAFDPDRAQRADTTDPPTNIRMVTASAWSERAGLLVYTVSGTGFLHHMVRNLVGTCLEVGCGQRTPTDMPAIFAARDRAAAGATAPARGLFLREVAYPDTFPAADSDCH